MRSAELPADLATIAREATRNGNNLAPARTARIIGLGHQVPPEVVPNADIGPRLGVEDDGRGRAPHERADQSDCPRVRGQARAYDQNVPLVQRLQDRIRSGEVRRTLRAGPRIGTRYVDGVEDPPHHVREARARELSFG